jgi:NTE family protein
MPQMPTAEIEHAMSPVEAPDEPAGPQTGVALCLSGGGYRAMLFHVGALWRLNDFGYLKRLHRVSSVSGGSIAAGALALHWSDLQFDMKNVAQNFAPFVNAVREMASHTIDVGAIAGGIFGPGSISDSIVAKLDQHLFKGKTLQDLPGTQDGDAGEPRFVINATNVQSGALWRFSKPYMRDYRVGEVKRPTVTLAQAVAASAAFPPFLSPLRLKLDPSVFTPKSGTDLQMPPYTSEAVLSDGGVYDNLGLETAWKRYKTILVSNGGGKMEPEEKPANDWARHSKRILDVIDNQVRSLRLRQVIGSFEMKLREGTYWGIRTDIREYELTNVLSCPYPKTVALAGINTRLERLNDDIQERLINWGYAVCDAAMRRRVDPTLAPPQSFPYPRGV